MKKVLILVVAVTFLLGMTDAAKAMIISADEYSLTAIIGSYAYGNTDWNSAYGPGGFVDNLADLDRVEGMMSDGYVYQPAGGSVMNGIYNWPTSGLHALEFAFDSGSDYILDQFSFISSRSYGDLTPITVDYALDGGSWMPAAVTTSGTLGITTGTAYTYDIALGGVKADRFRFTTLGGNQVSLHEIMVEGSLVEADNPPFPGVVPEPASMLLFGSGLLAAFVRRRSRD